MLLINLCTATHCYCLVKTVLLMWLTLALGDQGCSWLTVYGLGLDTLRQACIIKYPRGFTEQRTSCYFPVSYCKWSYLFATMTKKKTFKVSELLQCFLAIPSRNCFGPVQSKSFNLEKSEVSYLKQQTLKISHTACSYLYYPGHLINNVSLGP